MRFIVDAHLPIEIASWLNGRGYDAVHVRQIGLSDAHDGSIWIEALRSGSIVITKDSDFAHWAMSRTPRPSIIWLRTGNMRRQAQIDHFVRAWLAISTRLSEGVAIIEVR